MTDSDLHFHNRPTLIEQFFSGIQEIGLPAALERYVSPDANFIGVREDSSDSIPIYGTYHGHEEVARFFGILAEHFDTQRFEFHHAIEQGTLSLATGFFHHRVRATGEDFRSHWACLCHIEGGKISHYRFYEDTAALEAALHPSSLS